MEHTNLPYLARMVISGMNVGEEFTSEIVALRMEIDLAFIAPVSASINVLEKKGIVVRVRKEGRYLIFKKLREFNFKDFPNRVRSGDKKTSRATVLRKGLLKETYESSEAAQHLSHKEAANQIRTILNSMLNEMSKIDQMLERIEHGK